MDNQAITIIILIIFFLIMMNKLIRFLRFVFPRKRLKKIPPIIVQERRDDYIAYLQDNPHKWASGIDPAEAVGKLIIHRRLHPIKKIDSTYYQKS